MIGKFLPRLNIIDSDGPQNMLDTMAIADGLPVPTGLTALAGIAAGAAGWLGWRASGGWRRPMPARA